MNKLSLHAKLAVLVLWIGASCAVSAQSSWAHLGPDGRLVYAHTSHGDRIPDFSYAGYEGGGVYLPQVAAKRTVKPSGSDDTALIQKAIDAVSALPLVHGHRGAVELKAGTYHCSGTLTITASGVVLRGVGDAAGGTTIEMTGAPHLGIRIAGQLQQKELGAPTTITDAYVPAGSMVIHVASATGLHAGDTLLIRKPVTATWVHFMGMDTMRRNGKAEHWVRSSYLEVRRTVAAVHGDAITLTVPLMDDYDTQFFDGGHAQVSRIEVSGQIAQVGVEDLRFLAPQRSIAFTDAAFNGISIRDTVDSWLRAVALDETTSGVSVNEGSERLTFLKCDTTQHVPVTSHAKPADYAIDGAQILIDRCTGQGDSTFYIATQAGQQGPVVALHCRFLGDGHIQPHQRWFTGLLVDNCDVPGGGIDLMNRGEMGTGHGWTIGWSVVWNSTAQSFGMNTPPGSMIWSIGNRGEEQNPAFPTFDGTTRPSLQPATIESAGKPVLPQSLYLEQLQERLGASTVKAIGY